MTISQIIILVIGCLIIYLLLYRTDKNQGSNAAILWIKIRVCLWFLQNSPIYRYDIARAIVACVRANYRACELESPVDLTNHFAQMGTGAGINKNGQVVFRYKFRRDKISSGGGKLQYSTLPAEKMVESLNESFGSYCQTYGLLPRQIVSKEEADNGLVYFYVVAFNSVQEAIDYLYGVGVMI